MVRSEGSKNVGYVDDPKRFNVTLSRAKIALIIVGDKKFLSKKSRLLREFFALGGIHYFEKPTCYKIN